MKETRLLGPTEAAAMLLKCDSILESAKGSLQHAAAVVKSKDLANIRTSRGSDLDFESLNERPIASKVLGSTGTAIGHSNTDHIVSQTGDYLEDRFREIKRKYSRRLRSSSQLARATNRWDKPKIPGERRRRIVRDTDGRTAPHEPPPSGYTIFVGQMTTKMRHDRPHEPHDQTKVMQQISARWRSVLTDDEREEYNSFADQAHEEFSRQLREFRATGTYTPSELFEKKPGANVWVHKPYDNKNALERELETYTTFTFPPRPQELDADYKRREEMSKKKRRLKLKGFSG